MCNRFIRLLAPLPLFLILFGCGGGGGSSTAPTPTPTPSTFSLTGGITDSGSGHVLSGVTVTILDGPNANKSTTTDGIGLYEFDNLVQSGFTVRARATYYNDATKGINLTSSQSADFAMAHQAMNIEYRVTGTASRVDVFYENGTGGSESANGVRLPWSYKFQVAKAGEFLYLDATVDTSGSVTAEIYINGTLFKSATASGEFGSATADGETP